MVKCSRCTNIISSKEDVGFINHSTRNTSYYCIKCCKMLKLGSNEGRGINDQIEPLTFVGTVFEEKEFVLINKSSQQIINEVKEHTGTEITIGVKDKEGVLNKAKQILSDNNYSIVDKLTEQTAIIEDFADVTDVIEKEFIDIAEDEEPIELPVSKRKDKDQRALDAYEKRIKEESKPVIKIEEKPVIVEQPNTKEYVISNKTATKIIADVKELTGELIKLNPKSKKTIIKHAKEALSKKGFKIIEDSLPISPEIVEMIASSVKNMKKGIVGGTFNPNEFPEEILKIEGKVGINTKQLKSAKSIKPQSSISLVGKTARELIDTVKKFWGIEIKMNLRSKKSIYNKAVKIFTENKYTVK
jgi:hypothetical protein